MNNRYIKNINILVVLFVFIFLFFYNFTIAINTASDGYKIPSGGSVNIVSRQYFCTTTSNSSVFIPTRSDIEWDNFLNNKPSYITCIPYCADNTTDYTAWANTMCASNNLWNQTRSRTSTNCYDVQAKTRQSGSCDYCNSAKTENQSCDIANGVGTQTKTTPCKNKNYDTSNISYGSCTLVSCNANYVKSGNDCILRTCDFPDDYTQISYDCISNFYYDYYYDKKYSSTCSVPYGGDGTIEYTQSNNGYIDYIWCYGDRYGWDCARVGDIPPNSCWYCDGSFTATASPANDSNCYYRGIGNYSMNCNTSNHTWPGWSFQSCSCNAEYYGNSCESQCTYREWSEVERDCQSNGLWYAWYTRAVASGTNCGLTNWSGYIGEGCNYCNGGGQCGYSDENWNNNTCFSVSSHDCNYGYESKDVCNGDDRCFNDCYERCYYQCDTTKHVCTTNE